ncbi:3-hydroxyacyl-CoA dehydrogenase family protein [Paracoccus sp. N5]|uniref:3-hydroxyacyl-CoA dehydrogenase family protein n=1 Tax=Paracoccus sp. N5 TaxID=1101189 RepID=UPI000374F02E|nr:3-hydroxyacyl-CoA dehydrogenase family protein [Paracoccus sp. N5]
MRLSIIGAGTMGGGIAITSLKAGIPTTVVDTTDAALDRLRDRIGRHLAREVEKGRMDAAGADAARRCLTVSTELGAVSGSALLIEAVFEDLAVKHELLSRVQGLLQPEAVIATNTSCLLVADIARALDDPGRLLGLHYFSPAEICPMVEVISTSETRAAIRRCALDFLARTGKSPLPCKDSPGFALNRFFCPYCNEAVQLLDEGIATPGQIDAVACASFGVPAGPFRVMNLTKPVIMLRAMQGLERLGVFYRPAQGLLRAGGEGADWLIDGDPPALPDAARQEVARRLTMALCRPAAEALAEGAVAPEDLDRGAREALRFQRTPVTLLGALSPDDRRRLEARAAAKGA